MTERSAPRMDDPRRTSPRPIRVVALVGGFDAGPVYEPTQIVSPDQLSDRFGRASSLTTAVAHQEFMTGTGRLIVVRAGESTTPTASDLVMAVSALARTTLRWHEMVLPTVTELDAHEEIVVTEHARVVCAERCARFSWDAPRLLPSR